MKKKKIVLFYVEEHLASFQKRLQGKKRKSTNKRKQIETFE
jgi:hypothetical protein